MSASDPIIIARDLSHTYLSGPLARPALVGVSLRIARGSCAAIVGVTGSGKSTLVQHFNALLRPSAGSLVVDGIDLAAPGADVRAVRRRVGMLFQSPEAQLFAPTVLADVAFGPRQAGMPLAAAQARALTALEQVGLPPQIYAMRSPFDLSGGQMRRAALAGVLALDPSVLVLDEPTVGLDALGRAEFYAQVRRAQAERGVTVVLVSHDMAEVAALADQLMVLHAGQLVADGAPAELFARGAELRSWGLAAPPLADLLDLLRASGATLPAGLHTVAGAAAALRDLYAERRSGRRELRLHEEARKERKERRRR